ncbi:hypothetical protein KAJ27_15215 [bacterium]|nr:hypothetical protein [bacterium]
MSLTDWLNNGWLIEHVTSKTEVSDLISVVARDLNDSKIEGLSPDWRLSIAYNAALQIATAALAVSGYRASRESHHYRVIQSLCFTLKAEKKLVRKFDLFRKKRNIGGYERAGMISDQEAAEMHHLAIEINELVMNWIDKNYPEYMD